MFKWLTFHINLMLYLTSGDFFQSFCSFDQLVIFFSLASHHAALRITHIMHTSHLFFVCFMFLPYGFVWIEKPDRTHLNQALIAFFFILPYLTNHPTLGLASLINQCMLWHFIFLKRTFVSFCLLLLCMLTDKQKQQLLDSKNISIHTSGPFSIDIHNSWFLLCWKRPQLLYKINWFRWLPSVDVSFLCWFVKCQTNDS